MAVVVRPGQAVGQLRVPRPRCPAFLNAARAAEPGPAALASVAPTHISPRPAESERKVVNGRQADTSRDMQCFGR